MNGRDGLGEGLGPGLPGAESRTGGVGGPGGRRGRAAGIRGTLVHAIVEAPPALVVAPAGEGRDGRVLIDGVAEPVTLTRGDSDRARLQTAAGSHAVLITPMPDPRRAADGIRRVEIVLDGWRFEVDVQSEARARLRERATSADVDAAHGGPLELRAIIPGRVLSVDVAEGDTIEAGGRLLVIEAMKMQNELRAPRGGTVGRVAVGPGQTVELGDLLLVVE